MIYKSILLFYKERLTYYQSPYEQTESSIAFESHILQHGPVAQWITRLTTDQKIPGSTPGRLEYFL